MPFSIDDAIMRSGSSSTDLAGGPPPPISIKRSGSSITSFFFFFFAAAAFFRFSSSSRAAAAAAASRALASASAAFFLASSSLWSFLACIARAARCQHARSFREGRGGAEALLGGCTNHCAIIFQQWVQNSLIQVHGQLLALPDVITIQGNPFRHGVRAVAPASRTRRSPAKSEI